MTKILLPEEEEKYVLYGTRATFSFASDILANLLAACFILIPVIVLHFLHYSEMRLLAIVLFSLAFTFAMALFTDAKRGEVFAATCAFVAVQVVYVGSVVGEQQDT